MKLKKIIIFVTALMLMCSMFVSTAFAAEYPGEGSEAQEMEELRAEETEWHYRVGNNGMIEKRLWSITREIWLTDWMPM